MPVAGQRTHGTTFRALKVTSQVATPGAESVAALFRNAVISYGLIDMMNADRSGRSYAFWQRDVSWLGWNSSVIASSL